MKKVLITSVVLSAVLSLSSCGSSTAEQIQQLQQTQKQLSEQASQNLANIDSLQTKIVKYRLQADDLQKESDKLGSDIDDFKKAYSNFSDPNNDSAIAVNKELVQKTLQKAKIDEKINEYRTLANGYQSQINNLKATSQTQANQASKIAQQIVELQSKSK